MTAHVDTFARDRLPPPDQMPELIFELPELQFPQRLNAAVSLLDTRVAADGARPCVMGTGVRWIDLDCEIEVMRRFGWPTALCIGGAQIIVDAGVTLIFCHRPRKDFNGLWKFLFLNQGGPQKVRGHFVVWKEPLQFFENDDTL